MSLIIRQYNDLSGPRLFYGGTERLWFSREKWLWWRETPEGLQPLSGVTNTCHIIDRSQVLMPWAVKTALARVRSKLSDYRRGDGWIELLETEVEEILESARKADREILEDAGNVGHIAHAWVEDFIRNINNEPRRLELLAKLPEDERAGNACIASVGWMVTHKVEWVSTECAVYSRSTGVAGTMDGLAYVSSCDDPLCCPTPFERRLSVIDWKCLLPEQLLLRADGSTIRADQVMPGDLLLSYDEASGVCKPDRVKSVMPGGDQPSVEVITKRGRRLQVSSNHPVLIDNQWIEASSLKVDDLVTLATTNIPLSCTITENDSRLLGYFIGDGGFSDESSRTFTNTNPHVLEDCRTLCKQKGFTFTPSGKNGVLKHLYNIGGCGSFLREHDIYCRPSKEKHVPSAVMQGTREVIVAFLSSLFDCDGYIAKLSIGRPDCVYTTISGRLAEEVLELLHRIGIEAVVWRQDNKQYRKRRHDSPPYWVKVTSQPEAYKLLSVLRLRVASKRSRQEDWIRQLESVQRVRGRLSERPTFEDRVKEVIPLGTRRTIAIEMETIPTFITSGIVTHNTSNYLYIEHLLQTAKYWQMYEEEHPDVHIEDRWIIRLGKTDAEFDPWHAEGRAIYEEDLAAFHHALALATSLKGIEKRISGVKEVRKAARALAAQAAKRIRCPKAEVYKGKKLSKCFDDGSQCEACRAIYQTQHPEETNERTHESAGQVPDASGETLPTH